VVRGEVVRGWRVGVVIVARGGGRWRKVVIGVGTPVRLVVFVAPELAFNLLASLGPAFKLPGIADLAFAGCGPLVPVFPVCFAFARPVLVCLVTLE
jgi:hypothetical protein